MRIKRGTTSHRRHKKLLSSTKGYRMTKSRLIKVAKEAKLHAGQYAYSGRKKRKSSFRRLWITRISHRVKKEGMSYSKFIHNLKLANIQIDRKILSHLILTDDAAFKAVLATLKKN